MSEKQADLLTTMWQPLQKVKRLGKAQEWVVKNWRVTVPAAFVVAALWPASSLIGQWTMSEAERTDRGSMRLKAQQAVEATIWATGYDPVRLERVNGRAYWLLTFRFEKTAGYVNDQNRDVTVRCASIYAAETQEVDGAYPKPNPFIFGMLRWSEMASYCHTASYSSPYTPTYTPPPPATRQQLHQLRETG